MSAELISPLVGTVHFNRKVGLPNYSNTEFGLFVQFPITGDNEVDLQSVQDAAAFAKAITFEQLAEYGVKLSAEPGGYVRELLDNAFGTKSQRVTEVPAAVADAAPAHTEQPADAGNKPSWLPKACPDCGIESFWDNRPQIDSGKFSKKAPQFKCKTKDCSKGFWPPR